MGPFSWYEEKGEKVTLGGACGPGEAQGSIPSTDAVGLGGPPTGNGAEVQRRRGLAQGLGVLRLQQLGGRVGAAVPDGHSDFLG